MRKFIMAIIVILAVGLAATSFSQADSRRAAECSVYARNQSDMNSRGGGRVIGGAMGGAMGGGLFGAIIGGRRGARRGAVRSGQDRQMLYQQYYNACMHGQ